MRYLTYMVHNFALQDVLNSKVHDLVTWPEAERRIALHVLDSIALAFGMKINEQKTRNVTVDNDGACWTN